MHENILWIDKENIIMSAGIRLAIVMRRQLPGRRHRIEFAEKTARQMEYDGVKKPLTYNRAFYIESL